MLEKENFYNLRNRDVKRMLWPVDHEQTRQDLKKEQQKFKKELTERYNFDFETEQPLRGKYDWVSVSPETPIGSPYVTSKSVPCYSGANLESQQSSTGTSTVNTTSKRSTSSQKNVEKKKKRRANASSSVSSSAATYSLRGEKKNSSRRRKR